MLFNSVYFCIFFVVAVAIFFAIPPRRRWVFMLIASYYFYMCWKPAFIVLIIASTLVDYFVGLGLAKARGKAIRLALLMTSLTTNLGLLFTFKYLDLFLNSLEWTLSGFNVLYDLPSYHLLLPVGISFYTFQTLSYTIDVYRGVTPVERHLGIFAVYVAWFPQLVAGPIERSNHLLPQFRRETRLEFDRVRRGLQLILWGMFKKVAIADLIAPVVNTVYAAPQQYSGPVLVLATLFFSAQIYCDFSRL